MLELKGFDFILSHLRAGMADNFSKGNSVGENFQKTKNRFKINNTAKEQSFFPHNMLLPVMLFPSRSILSSVAISVSFSGKMEKLLLAKLMLVKCSISPTSSGSLVKMLPCRSSSTRHFKIRINGEMLSVFLPKCKNLQWIFVVQTTSKQQLHL